jgi:hypothetical protein
MPVLRTRGVVGRTVHVGFSITVVEGMLYLRKDSARRLGGLLALLSRFQTAADNHANVSFTLGGRQLFPIHGVLSVWVISAHVHYLALLCVK